MNHIYYQGEKITPSKIVCIGRNYVDHIRELGNDMPTEPVIFIKPNSAISDEMYTHPIDSIHYEGEISFLILAGQLKAVAFGLDLTKREVQFQLKDQGLPWERSKAFDRSAVFSEFIEFQGAIEDLRLELSINGKLTQQANYELMLNKPEAILEESKSFLSFEDGDIIMTGTPKGVGAIHAGDIFVGRIFLKNDRVLEKSWTVQ